MKTLRVIPMVLTVAVILGSVGCKKYDTSESLEDEFEITEVSAVESIESTIDETTVSVTNTDATVSVATSETTAESTTEATNTTPAEVPREVSDATEGQSNSAPTAAPATSATQATSEPTSTPVPTETPTPEPTATPVPTDTPTPTPTIAPVYDPQYTSCIADFGWEAGDDYNGYTTGTVYGVPCRRNSAGYWIPTDEGDDMIADAAFATGAGGYSDWIIEGSQRDFS